MEQIISAVDKPLIEKELTKEKFLRKSNLGNNELYIVTAHDSPNIMKEVGRLREIAFRKAGGGTGKSIDIDEFDTSDNPYHQLIVWDPEIKEILGGYRYYICGLSKPENDLHLASTELFKYSDKFINNYLPHLIELGRSFVQPDFQTTGSSRKELFALDNLFNGLGALIMRNPDKKYFFGKVTMYADYDLKARDYLLYFMKKYFGDNEHLMETRNEIKIQTPESELALLFTGSNYKEDHRILFNLVKERGELIPPLINAYMNLSPTMKVFGTGINDHFGDVIETGIMVTIPDMYPDRVARHMEGL